MLGKFRFLLCVCLLMTPMVVGAASNGCDDSDNEYITPELALCSTHVYNIGQTTNPSNDTERGYMKDMVALKSTIMTQQLNKQYEYLESMIRRFKTQLEKAILTTRLQTSGAGTGGASSGGSSSFKSEDRNVFMAWVRNCNDELLPTDVMSCLNSNLNTISKMSGNADKVSVEMRKQLANDFKLLNDTVIKGISSCSSTQADSGASCLKYNEISKKKDFQDCFDKMRSCLRNKSYDLSMQANQKKE